MLDFRKALLALGVATLGLASSASAQILTGSAITTTPGYAAFETTTALVPSATGNLTIPFTGTTSSSVTIILTANVPFTNVAKSSTNSNLDIVVTDNGGDNYTTTGQYTSLSPTQLQIVLPSVSDTATTFTITGVRVNASLVPTNSAITISASGVAGGGFSDSATATTVDYVVKSLAIPSFTTPGQPNVSSCSANLSTTFPIMANLNLTEGFARSLQTIADNSAPGSVAATQGTRLAVTFNNLNVAGVNYYAPTTLSAGTLALTAYTGPTGTTTPTVATSPTGIPGGLFLLTPSNGSATVYYGVTADDSGTVQTVTVPIYENVPSASAVTSYTTTPISASVLLVGPATGYPQYSASEAPYTASQTTQTGTNGLLTACSTTILLPYVTNTGGYDTGVALVNASSGTSTVASPVAAAAGTCSVTFYGTGVPSTNPYVTGVLSAGSIATFDVGTVAPGFSGYAVAVCNFSGGHSYAFISNGLGTGNGVASNYLGVVIGDQNLATPGVVAQ